jgi:hypothetical protein
MGTRSLTIVRNGNEPKSKRIITMYRQMDGYPEGHGIQLAEFLSQITLVNGWSMGEKRKVANGVGCLAAQLVAHFKGGTVGGFYLEAGSDRDAKGTHGEEYIYEIFADTFDIETGIKLTCYSVYDKKLIFSGSPMEFLAKYSPQTVN